MKTRLDGIPLCGRCANHHANIVTCPPWTWPGFPFLRRQTVKITPNSHRAQPFDEGRP